jgi:hypothetical protein
MYTMLLYILDCSNLKLLYSLFPKLNSSSVQMQELSLNTTSSSDKLYIIASLSYIYSKVLARRLFQATNRHSHFIPHVSHLQIK